MSIRVRRPDEMPHIIAIVPIVLDDVNGNPVVAAFYAECECGWESRQCPRQIPKPFVTAAAISEKTTAEQLGAKHVDFYPKTPREPTDGVRVVQSAGIVGGEDD